MIIKAGVMKPLSGLMRVKYANEIELYCNNGTMAMGYSP